ncbi:hypothetical protein ACED16_02490 [Enterobacter hormaechei]
MSEENSWCIQEWAIDTKQTAYAQISEKLLNLKGVTPTQHLFIIKVAMHQMRRKSPFVCQKDFVSDHNGKPSSTTLTKEINEIIQRGIISKYGVIKEGLARNFLLSDEFMIEMGYKPVGDKTVIHDVSVKESSKKEPTHSTATLIIRKRIEDLHTPEIITSPVIEKTEEEKQIELAETLPIPDKGWLLEKMKDFAKYGKNQMAFMKIAYHNEQLKGVDCD